MIARKKIPTNTVNDVLTLSRRRCCVCLGLHRDDRVKPGQIAHLDQDPSNNEIDNLAFLCFEHHDLFDSTTRQSKNLTKDELKTYRLELYKQIREAWEKPIIPNEKIRADIYTGTYVTGDRWVGAELDIKYLGGNLIQVIGGAFFYRTKEAICPNVGELDFVTEIIDINRASFTATCLNLEYEMDLTFLGNKLLAVENDCEGYFGHRVSFQGEYFKSK